MSAPPTYWQDKPRKQIFGYSDQGHEIHEGKVPFLNLEMLQDEGKDSGRINRQIFKLILARCHKYIKRVNRETESRECRYQIPYFLPGYPAYKIGDAKNYLITHLRENGLRADNMEGSYIFISWAPNNVNYQNYQSRIDRMAERSNVYKVGVSPLANPARARNRSNSRSNQSPSNPGISLLQLDSTKPDFIPVNTEVMRRDYPELIEKSQTHSHAISQIQAQEKTSIFRERLREQREKGKRRRSQRQYADYETETQYFKQT